MGWVELTAAVVVTAALMVVPGVPVAWAAGLRGFWLLGASVPLAATVIGGSAMVAPRLGLDWGVTPAVLGLVGLTLAAGLVRWGLSRTRAGAHWNVADLRHRSLDWIGAVAALGAAGVISARLMGALPRPSSMSYSWDGQFHVNAVRWVMDTGDASPAGVVAMTSTNTGGFYPSGFHAVASLSAQLTGVEAPVALNAMWIAMIALFPVAAVLLARSVVGASRAIVVAAAIVSVALPAFVLQLSNHGVVFPQLASYTVLAFVLAVSVRALGLSLEDGAERRPSLGLLLVVTAGLPGLALMHPSALVAWLFITTPWVLVAVWRIARKTAASARRWVTGSGVVWLVIVLAASRVLRPSASASAIWEAEMTKAQALGEWLLLTSAGEPVIPYLVVIAVWVGVISALRGRGRPGQSISIDHRLVLLAGPVIVGILCFVASSVASTRLRSLLIQPWYSDAPRLAALMPIVIVPVAALGIAHCWQFVRDRERVARLLNSAPRVAAAGLGAALVLALGTQANSALGWWLYAIEQSRTPGPERLVDTDELALIERIRAQVPADAVIAGSPWTGTGFSYAVSGRRVLYPHMSVTQTADVALVTEQLRWAKAGDEVCQAAERLGIEYALDFGSQDIFYDMVDMPGLEHLDSSEAFELVDEEGHAQLHRLVACD